MPSRTEMGARESAAAAAAEGREGREERSREARPGQARRNGDGLLRPPGKTNPLLPSLLTATLPALLRAGAAAFGTEREGRRLPGVLPRP